MKIFFHFLEVSMINAYTIYKKVYEKYNAEPMSHLEFRKDITSKQKRKESNSGIEIYRHNLKNCKLGKIPTTIYRMTNRYPCQLHKEEGSQDNKRPPQTSFWCETCEIPLCKKSCFDKHCP